MQIGVDGFGNVAFLHQHRLSLTESASDHFYNGYLASGDHFYISKFLRKLTDVNRLLSRDNSNTNDNINNVACAPSEDSDQPGHPPSLIKVCAVGTEVA